MKYFKPVNWFAEKSQLKVTERLSTQTLFVFNLVKTRREKEPWESPQGPVFLKLLRNKLLFFIATKSAIRLLEMSDGWMPWAHASGIPVHFLDRGELGMNFKQPIMFQHLASRRRSGS